MTTSEALPTPERAAPPGGQVAPAAASVQAQAVRPDRYELRELTAQEVTADASFWMAVAAILTLIVTATGTLLIWGQVKLTRRAVQEAVAGTEAVREANAITREIGQAQARCYLSTNDVKFRIDPLGIPHISMNVLNSGQSPARNFRWTFQVRMKVMPNGWEWENPPNEPGGGRDIPAQQAEALELGIIDGKPLPQGDLSDLLLEPEVRTTVGVKAVWADVFGNEWRETWRLQAMGPTGMDVDMPMFPDFPGKP